MAALDGKYNIKLDGNGYIVFRNRTGVSYYQKKRAPCFVGKFGSGDSSYRDSTYWQFFAQINWRNGCKQEKFDDGGKFWKSDNCDINELSKVKLSRQLVSAGQVEAGTVVQCLAAWRSSQSWWNASYGYRQQITITAPSDKQVPAGYPIKVTIDTATLETAGKVRSDRKDWRIVYWNGSAWEDLVRDYVATDATFFGTKKAIAASQSDNNYYAYYGYASESTTKQASSASDYNEIYVPEDDDNVIMLWHFYEGSGNTIHDTSGSSLHGSGSGLSWGTNGVLGRYAIFADSGDKVTIASSSLALGSIAIEARIYPTSFTNGIICGRLQSGSDITDGYILWLRTDGKLLFRLKTASGEYNISSNAALTLNAWNRIACTYDGSGIAQIYINNELDKTDTSPSGALVGTSGGVLYVGKKDVGGADQFYGRIQHLRISNIPRSSFPDHLAAEPSTAYGSEATTQPPSSSFTQLAGLNNGKIYFWDGDVTWTEEFDCRELDGYEAGGDTDNRIGDTGGTEYKQAQGFQLSTEEAKSQVGGIRAYLKNITSCTGDITVRIETDNAGVPSGTLADANAVATIPASEVGTPYGWITANFASSFALSASTQYWLVLSVDAQDTNVGYDWQSDASSPTYSDGSRAYHDGSWHADADSDLLFNILSRPTSVNCFYITSIGGTQKLLIGTGAIDSETNGDARLYTYDGNSWVLAKTFNTATECQITAITEFASKAYLAIGPQAKVYETDDLSTFDLSKDIDTPQKPGYIYALVEYNQALYAMGGSPEFMHDKYYDGFCWMFDGTTWQLLQPFDHTVLKSASFYDAFLFMGTYHGQLYVYNMSTLDPLFSLKEDYDWKCQFSCMKYFDDKLFLGLYPQDESGETNVGIMVFDRHGLSMKHTIAGIKGITALEQVNNVLMVGTGDDGYVYKLDPNVYVSEGWVQSSYFDAVLPSIDKLYNEVTISYKPLPAGTSITLYYKFKEADSWTELGTADTIGSIEKSFSFPEGCYSKKISLKYKLETTDTSSSPEINEVILRYSLFPVTKWQWNIRIVCKNKAVLLDRSRDTRTAAQIRSALETALASKELHTLTDLDGQTYTVLFNDLDQNSWIINQDEGSENTIPISLIEA